MRSLRTNAKLTKYLLSNFNGNQIFLSVPSECSKEQKYYISYYNGAPLKYYGKGSVKRKTIEFFNSISEELTFSQKEARLAEIFKPELQIIESELEPVLCSFDLSLRSLIVEVLSEFYRHKQLQNAEGTVDKVSMYGYKHHQLKLISYFNLPRYKKLTIADLSSNLWQNYRIDLINNTYGISKKKLKNSSVNQHFQYVTQFYTWLIEYNELPIRNHLKKLKRLSEASHDKRFKVIPNELFRDFYSILETKEKLHYTRLYLASLFLYENNIRLSEQVLIQVKDMDLSCDTIRILNKKNDSIRTVIISAKAKELICIILNNTSRKEILICDDMYLFGGYNRLKSGMPLTHKELGIVMREFRLKYPQFKSMTLYEQKHTSITNQFNNGVDHYKIKERANHSSISTTEIYLQATKIVQPYILQFENEPVNSNQEI